MSSILGQFCDVNLGRYPHLLIEMPEAGKVHTVVLITAKDSTPSLQKHIQSICLANADAKGGLGTEYI
jgi:hypothetical protein